MALKGLLIAGCMLLLTFSNSQGYVSQGTCSNEGITTEECKIECNRDNRGRVISCTESGEVVTCDCKGNELTVGGEVTCQNPNLCQAVGSSPSKNCLKRAGRSCKQCTRGSSWATASASFRKSESCSRRGGGSSSSGECTPGESVPSPYDSCNTCTCGVDGIISACSVIACQEHSIKPPSARDADPRRYDNYNNNRSRGRYYNNNRGKGRGNIGNPLKAVGTTALLGGLGVAGLGAVTGNTHLRNSGLNVAIAGGATKVLGHLLGKKK